MSHRIVSVQFYLVIFYIIIAFMTAICISSFFINLLLAWPLQEFLSTSHILAAFRQAWLVSNYVHKELKKFCNLELF